MEAWYQWYVITQHDFLTNTAQTGGRDDRYTANPCFFPCIQDLICTRHIMQYQQYEILHQAVSFSLTGFVPWSSSSFFLVFIIENRNNGGVIRVESSTIPTSDEKI